MADETKMMFVRPRNCHSCGNGFFGLGHVVEYAQQIGAWDILDLAEGQAVQSNVFQAIDDHDPFGIYGFGHGAECIYTGDTEQEIFSCEECDRLNGRIVYLLSCLTANGLGPEIMNQGAVAYAGFNISWTWISENVDGDPYEDLYALGFYQSANELWMALLDGADFIEAVQASIDMYNYWIDYWWDNPGAPWSQDAIQWLLYDRDGLVALTYCDTIVLQEECETLGCHWYNDACHTMAEHENGGGGNWLLLLPVIAVIGIAFIATKK